MFIEWKFEYSSFCYYLKQSFLRKDHLKSQWLSQVILFRHHFGYYAWLWHHIRKYHESLGFFDNIKTSADTVLFVYVCELQLRPTALITRPLLQRPFYSGYEETHFSAFKV